MFTPAINCADFIDFGLLQFRKINHEIAAMLVGCERISRVMENVRGLFVPCAPSQGRVKDQKQKQATQSGARSRSAHVEGWPDVLYLALQV